MSKSYPFCPACGADWNSEGECPRCKAETIHLDLKEKVRVLDLNMGLMRPVDAIMSMFDIQKTTVELLSELFDKD